jgi:hypothetical protein
LARKSQTWVINWCIALLIIQTISLFLYRLSHSSIICWIGLWLSTVNEHLTWEVTSSIWGFVLKKSMSIKIRLNAFKNFPNFLIIKITFQKTGNFSKQRVPGLCVHLCRGSCFMGPWKQQTSIPMGGWSLPWHSCPHKFLSDHWINSPLGHIIEHGNG